MKHRRELRYVAKVRENCVYMDNISLCIEINATECMVGIVVNKMYIKTLVQVLISN